MSANNNQQKSFSNTDNGNGKNKNASEKSGSLVTNKLLQPVIPDQKWPYDGDLIYHKFTSILEETNPKKYWDIAFTDNLEFFQYNKLDMGKFTKVGTPETTKQNPNVKSYGNHVIGDITTIKRRTVKVTPSSQLLGTVTSFSKGKENVTTFEYVTTQQKYGNIMQFNIEFDDFWSQYFPKVAGIVTVDYVDKKNHTGTIQTVELVAKINFGWDQGIWSYLGSIANSTIEFAFKSMIQSQMQKMINLVPDYLSAIDQHKI